MIKANFLEILSNKTLFIFDFDGVLAESVNIKTEAFRSMYTQYGEEIAERVVKHHLNHAGISRYKKFSYYHSNYLNKELNSDELKHLCQSFSKLVKKNVIQAPAVMGSVDFLEKLNKNNKTCVINTGTPTEEIKEILLKRKIDYLFKAAYGSPSSKVENLTKLTKKFDTLTRRTIFFGDANTDLNAAKELNMDFIYIGNSIKLIQECNKEEMLFFSNFYELSKYM